jgi:UDP-2,3-diacylglucosamine hydrolase
MKLAAPKIAELKAPASWQVIDFISDLHLHAADPSTFQLWENYLTSTRADAVFILGDLFDVWIGDDAISKDFLPGSNHSSFENHCARILKAASQRCALFFMHGNRDFLFGAEGAKRCGLQLLEDPTVLTFQDQRYLLTHGDTLCLEDTAYQKFRLEVRSAAWQQAFLAKPLNERKAIAQVMRAQSERQKSMAQGFADVDTQAALLWLQEADAPVMIHGHTHRPDDHFLAPDRQRHVLCDWDGAAAPQRFQVMRLGKTKTDSLAGLKRLSAFDHF